MAPDGTIAREIGDSAALVYPRSSLKPLQAITVMRCGVALDGEQAVLATASHSGQCRARPRCARHASTRWFVRGGLALPGRMAPETPTPCSRRNRAASARAAITMNCSGKHAGFLMACVENGWSIRGLPRPAASVAAAGADYGGGSSRASGWSGSVPTDAVPRCSRSASLVSPGPSAASVARRLQHDPHAATLVSIDPGPPVGHPGSGPREHRRDRGARAYRQGGRRGRHRDGGPGRHGRRREDSGREPPGDDACRVGAARPAGGHRVGRTPTGSSE